MLIGAGAIEVSKTAGKMPPTLHARHPFLRPVHKSNHELAQPRELDMWIHRKNNHAASHCDGCVSTSGTRLGTALPHVMTLHAASSLSFRKVPPFTKMSHNQYMV